MKKICEYCNSQFSTYQSNRRFCSKACAQKYNESGTKNEQNIMKILQYCHLNYDYRCDNFRIKDDIYYQPDFYLYIDNTYYQFYNKKKEPKANLFKQRYINENLIIIDNDMYNDLINQFKDKINFNDNINLNQCNDIYKYRYNK